MYVKRLALGRTCILCSVLPVQSSINDEKQSQSAALSLTNPDSGIDRLYKMFSLDEVGSYSQQVTASFGSAVLGALVGAMYGGYTSMKPSTEEIRNISSTALKTRFDDRHKATVGQDFFLNFLKGSVHWAWRAGILCGSFAIITTTISEYRGKSGVLEYTVAGSVIGPFFGWKGGLRTMGLTGLLGLALGAFSGCATHGYKVLTGTRNEDLDIWHHGWQENQLKLSKQKVDMMKKETKQLVDESERRQYSNSHNNSSSD